MIHESFQCCRSVVWILEIGNCTLSRDGVMNCRLRRGGDWLVWDVLCCGWAGIDLNLVTVAIVMMIDE